MYEWRHRRVKNISTNELLKYREYIHDYLKETQYKVRAEDIDYQVFLWNGAR